MANNKAQVIALEHYADLIRKQTGRVVRPYRADGYVNLVNKYGTSRDTTEKYQFQQEPLVPDETLTMFYEGNGLFAKIIDAPAEEAIKNGFTLTDLNDQKLEDFYMEALDELDWEETVITAVKWARLFGGSIAVMLINDGRGLEQPLDWKSIKSIDDIRIYDRSQIQPAYETMLSYEPDDPFGTRGSRLGMPEYYDIHSKYGNFRVHDSRCLVFQNGILPENTTNSLYQLWGMPEYVRLKRAIRDAEIAHGTAPKLLERSIQAIYKMKDLSGELATEDGEDRVLRRLQTIDMARGLLNSITIDSEGEEYDFRTFSFNGVSEIIDATCNFLSALTCIPQTVLFGRSPAGMNSTGTSDLENWYNYLQRIQKRMIKKNLRYLLSIIFQAGVMTGEIDEVPNIKVEFNPLWSLSEMEQAQLDQAKAAVQATKANTAAIYVDMQAIDPTEVRKKLADSEEFDVENLLDEYDEEDLFPEGELEVHAPTGQQGEEQAEGGMPGMEGMPGMPGMATPEAGGQAEAPQESIGQEGPSGPQMVTGSSVEEHDKDMGGNAPAAAPAATKLPQDMSDKEKINTDADGKPASWITVENGEHVPLNESGQVIGGVGGSLNGKDYSSSKSTRKENTSESDKWSGKSVKERIENSINTEGYTAGGKALRKELKEAPIGTVITDKRGTEYTKIGENEFEYEWNPVNHPGEKSKATANEIANGVGDESKIENYPTFSYNDNKSESTGNSGGKNERGNISKESENASKVKAQAKENGVDLYKKFVEGKSDKIHNLLGVNMISGGNYSAESVNKEAAAAIDSVFTPSTKDMTLYKGLPMTEEMIDDIKNGKTYTNRTLSSSTTDRHTADDYASNAYNTEDLIPVVMKIKLKEGTPVADAQKILGSSGMKGYEKEITVGRNTDWEYGGIKNVGTEDDPYYEVEVTVRPTKWSTTKHDGDETKYIAFDESIHRESNYISRGAVGIYVINDGKILSGTRKAGDGTGLKGGPGGHIEEGETPAQAAIRETQEEFGITPMELIPFGKGEKGSSGLQPYLFLCLRYEGEPKCDDGEMSFPVFRRMEDYEADKDHLFPAFWDGLRKLKKKVYGDISGKALDMDDASDIVKMRKNFDSNPRLPFGLCKREGIELPKDAEPADAWNALKEKTGKTQEDYYESLKNWTPIKPSAQGANTRPVGFENKDTAEYKVRKHGIGYPGLTVEQFETKACDLLEKPCEGDIDGYALEDGSYVRYDKRTGDFAVGYPGYYVKTMYNLGYNKNGNFDINRAQRNFEKLRRRDEYIENKEE